MVTPVPPPPPAPTPVINQGRGGFDPKQMAKEASEKALERTQRLATASFNIDDQIQAHREAQGKMPPPVGKISETKNISPPFSPLPKTRRPSGNDKTFPATSQTSSLPVEYLPVSAPPTLPSPSSKKNQAVEIARTAIKYTPRPSVPIPSAIRTGLSVAALGALYTWTPIKTVVQYVVMPSAKLAVTGLGYAGVEVAKPFQALGAYFAYEKLKDVFSGCFKIDPVTRNLKLDTKKAVVYSAIVTILFRDDNFRDAAELLLTPTVLATGAACAAYDYAGIIANEDHYIPNVLVETAQGAAQTIDNVVVFSSRVFQYLQQKMETPDQTAEEVKESFLQGVEALFKCSNRATVLGTAATVAAFAAGFKELGVGLAWVTAVPFGMVLSQQKV